MGEFLSTPIKDKQSEESENTFVSFSINTSADMGQVECRDGENEWKTLIFLILP